MTPCTACGGFVASALRQGRCTNCALLRVSAIIKEIRSLSSVAGYDSGHSKINELAEEGLQLMGVK